MYAVYQALHTMDRRQENRHGYTVFVDSTAAIERVRPDGIGLGQRFAVATIEVGTRLRARNNEATARWVPAHRGVLGNEEAVADGGEPNDVVPHDYRWETSLFHMTRMATPVDCRQHWGPPTGVPPPFGEGLERRLLQRERKSAARRYYQLLSGHAAIGPYLRDKLHKTAVDKCWRCGGGRNRPVHGVQGLAPADHEAVEGDMEGVRVETPKSPLGKATLEGEGYGNSVEVPEGHQGGVHQYQKEVPGRRE